MPKKTFIKDWQRRCTCTHAKSNHYGPHNDGRCIAEGATCTCEAFQEDT